jgi:hypothetical protein
MRLTKTAKEDIKTLLCKRAFDDRFDNLNARKKIIGQEAIIAIWGAPVYRLVEELLTIQPNAIPQAISVNFSLDGDGYVEWQARQFNFSYMVPIMMQAGCSHASNHFHINEIRNERMQADVIAIIKEHAELLAEHEKFAQELHCVLYAANTYKQLYQVFPELKELSELIEPENGIDVANKSTALLPCIDNLKKALKLPSEQYGAAA